MILFTFSGTTISTFSDARVLQRKIIFPRYPSNAHAASKDTIEIKRYWSHTDS